MTNSEKFFMLTFDVEKNFPPHGKSYEGVSDALPKILDVLDDEGIRTTMFVTGRSAELYPDIIRRASRKHEIQCHTYNHDLLDRMTKDEQMESISKCKRALESITGKEVYGFRAPYLRFNRDTIEVLNELGFKYDSSIMRKNLIGHGLAAIKKINNEIFEFVFNPGEELIKFHKSMTSMLSKTMNLRKMTKKDVMRFFYYITSPSQFIENRTENVIESSSLREIKINLRSILLRLPTFNASMIDEDVVVSYLHPWEFIDLKKYTDITGLLMFNWLFSGEKLLNALRERIRSMKARGYKFVTMSEYIELNGGFEKQI